MGQHQRVSAKRYENSTSFQFSEAARNETGAASSDILVNNAGIAPALPLRQTNEVAFDEIMTINYKAPFFLIQAVADHIRDNGRIVGPDPPRLCCLQGRTGDIDIGAGT
jgi:NAD(P)-dependent dehydrogenase (short-subunit alcohol dehydrogenase family)